MGKTAYINGKIYTVNEKQPWAEAILVNNNKIASVGSNKEIHDLIDNDTIIVDLNHKMVLPGFIDSHTHIFLSEFFSRGIQFDLNSSKETILEKIQHVFNSNPNADLIYGQGVCASSLGKTMPTIKDLDAITPDIPIMILDDGSHSMWVNSKTLELANITKDTPDPIPGGDFYDRDSDGNLTGWIVESYSMRPIVKALNIFNDFLKTDLSPMFETLSSHGITSVFNASEFFYNNNGIEPLEFMQKLADNNNSRVRFFTSYSYNNHEGDSHPLETLLSLSQKYRSDYVKIDTFKIWLDGTTEARNAALHEPYEGHSHTVDLFYDVSELELLINQTQKLGLSLHLHAIGDKTIDTALDLCTKAKNAYPNTGGTQTIAHVEVFSKDTISKFSNSSVIANTTPSWHVASESSQQNLGSTRYHNMYKFNSLIKAGVTTTFGSDNPAGILDVFCNMQAGHTRTFPNKTEALPNTDENLSIHDLIKGYTLNGAIQVSMEDKIGSIEVGKYADFIILEQNLFEQPPHEIHLNKVIKTIFDGKLIYER